MFLLHTQRGGTLYAASTLRRATLLSGHTPSPLLSRPRSLWPHSQLATPTVATLPPCHTPSSVPDCPSPSLSDHPLLFMRRAQGTGVRNGRLASPKIMAPLIEELPSTPPNPLPRRLLSGCNSNSTGIIVSENRHR